LGAEKVFPEPLEIHFRLAQLLGRKHGRTQLERKLDTEGLAQTERQKGGRGEDREGERERKTKRLRESLQDMKRPRNR
jgi:hypothetical protein